MVHRRGPHRLPDPGLIHAEELVTVQVPADLLVIRLAPIDDHGVGVEILLASGAGLQTAPQAGTFMAGTHSSVGITLGQVPAMKGARLPAEAVDVLQDVDLAGPGPAIWSEHPEPRPVPQRVGRSGLLDRRGDHHLPAGRRSEQALGLEPGRGPRGTAAASGTVP